MHEKLTYKSNQPKSEWETLGQAVKELFIASFVVVCCWAFVWALSIIFN